MRIQSGRVHGKTRELLQQAIEAAEQGQRVQIVATSEESMKRMLKTFDRMVEKREGIHS